MNLLVAYISIVAAGVSLGADLAAEPNGPDIPILAFKKTDARTRWEERLDRNLNLVWPTVVAEFYVGGSFNNDKLSDHVRLMQKTLPWGTVSEHQLAFCRLYRFIDVTRMGEGTSLERHIRVQILAVSHSDAEGLGKAFLIALAISRSTYRAEWRNRTREALATYEKQIQDQKVELADALSELVEVRQAYETIKNNNRYRSRADDDASDAAQATSLRMDAQLDDIEVSVAEIRARLEIIEKYKHIKKKVFDEKLELMEIELTIELTGLMARRNAIAKIVEQAKDLRVNYLRMHYLQDTTDRLSGSIKGWQSKIDERSRLLVSYVEDDPPEVRAEYATIHPVILRF